MSLTGAAKMSMKANPPPWRSVSNATVTYQIRSAFPEPLCEMVVRARRSQRVASSTAYHWAPPRPPFKILEFSGAGWVIHS